jgi:hypothetical protein
MPQMQLASHAYEMHQAAVLKQVLHFVD